MNVSVFMLDFRNSYLHPQPPSNHSTVWTGALLGKPMQPMERSLLLLPPPRILALSVIVVAAALADPAPAAAFPDKLVPVPAETNSQRLFETSQCSPQNGL